jgi:predicted phage terminase large subunit-like protein
MSGIVFQAQPGPQEEFLASRADVVVYGGSAGGGKSFALLLEAARHTDNPHFGAVIFRRTSPQITNQGALWDESGKIYPFMGATGRVHKLDWVFPSGAKIRFSHMEYEKNRLDWQGSQIPMIGFDELTHFTLPQFLYMLSRNRSTCGVKPYIRATCNPDSKSWVRQFIDWWIDPETGYAIPERSGVVRYFINLGEVFHWGDTPEELQEKFKEHGDAIIPKSFTFIRSSLADNKVLMDADPGYMANLLAMPLIEREQLLNGNWNISADGGIIRPEWIRKYSQLPPEHEIKNYVWSLDTAIKEGEENDFSVLQLWAEAKNGYYLVSQIRDKLSYPALKRKALDVFDIYPATEILIEDKASGQQLIQDFKRDTTLPVIPMMPGRNMGRSKVERCNFVSTLFEAGKVYVPEGAVWVNELIQEWIAFPNAPHDDTVDAMTQYLSRKLKERNTGIINCAAPVTTGGVIADYEQSFHETFKYPFQ